MRKTGLILRKELKRVFDDPKLMFGLFITPMLSIVIMYSFMGIFISHMLTKTMDHACQIAYQGPMPAAIQTALEREDSLLTAIDPGQVEALTAQIKEEKLDLILVFAQDFDQALAQGGLPQVEAYYDGSSDSSQKAYDLFEQAAEAYRQDLLAQKLGGQDQLKLFEVDTVSLENKQETTGRLVGSLFVMFLVLFLFSSSMQQGIDMIAGEKERGVFATLLMTPVSRTSIAAGKAICLTILSLLSALSIFVGVVLSGLLIVGFTTLQSGGSLSQLAAGAGAAIAITPAAVLTLLLQMLLIGVLSSAVICFLSSFAKTAKQASTYITPVYIASMLVCYLPLLTQGASAQNPLIYLIPLYGSISAIVSLMGGALTGLQLLCSVVSTLCVVALLIYLSSRLYGKEKYLF